MSSIAYKRTQHSVSSSPLAFAFARVEIERPSSGTNYATGFLLADGLQDEVHVERLDWGDSLVSADETVEDVESRSAFEDLVERSQPDLILAADVVSGI